MNKISKLTLATLMLTSIMGCSSNNVESNEGTYSYQINGYDWGPGTDKVILNMNDIYKNVDASDFIVKEKKQIVDWSKEDTPVSTSTVKRKITDAYYSNKDGKKSNKETQYISLELYVSPNEGSPLLYEPHEAYNLWSKPYTLNVALSKKADLTKDGKKVTSLTLKEDKKANKTCVDNLKIKSFTSSDNVTYKYGSYIPDGGSDTLVVWLHGGGEGGSGNKNVGSNTDPHVTALGNKVSALLSDEFQNTIGKANVLVPECPTMWMDPTGDATSQVEYVNATGKSYYTNSLHELINSYKEKVGAKKVILTGCSNGGYMSVLLGSLYPNDYDAIVPISESMQDKHLSDEQIANLATIPLYFVYSQDDDVVDPNECSIPTIQRIKDANTKDLNVSTSEHVIDTTGTYYSTNDGAIVNDDTGTPYQYSGHWSWIYFFNNECNANGIKAWDFIAKYAK